MSTHTATSKALRTSGLTFAALLVFAFLVMSIGYLLRHTLIMMIAAPALSPYSIELRSISGLQIGLDAISIDTIRFVVVDADNNASLQESSVNNLKITFTPRELLAGRVQDIEIATLALFGTPSSATESAAAPSANAQRGSALQLEAIATALQGLPLNSISVDDFSMSPYFSNANIATTRNQREVSVLVTASDFRLSLQTNWHDTEFISSYFISDADLPGHVFPGDALTGAMRLYFRDALAASVDFSLGETDNLLVLDTNAEVQLSTLMPFLQEHELVGDELAAIDGTLRFSALAKEQPTADAVQHLTFALSLSGDSHASGPVPFPGDPSATFLWPEGQPLQVSGSYAPESGQLNLNAADQSIHVTLQNQGESTPMTLALADFAAQCTRGSGCTATQSSALHAPFATSGNVTLENISIATNATLVSAENDYTLRFATGSRITFGSIISGAATLHDVDLLLLETLTVEAAESGTLQAMSDAIELNLPSVLFEDSTTSLVLTTTDLVMHWPAEADVLPAINARLQIRNLGSDLLPVAFKNPEIDATVAIENNALQLVSQVRLADRHVLQIDAAHSLTSGTGEGTFEVPSLQFDEGQLSLSQLFFSMPYEADLIAGAFAATAHLSWHQDDAGRLLASGPVTVTADRLSGYYEDIALLELSTVIVGELADLQFISGDNLQMQIGGIDPGLPAENITFDYSIDSGNTTLEIRNVQATMFNGTLSSMGLAFDWSAPENLFALAFDDIDLSRLLAMGAYEGINATGLVSGALPVRIAGSNVSVDGGTLQVQAPGGSISYQPATAGDTGNAALDLVNLALSNYQYDVMDAEVDYLPSGELILAVKLEGISPAVNGGQQINVNLNVTDNIPALLESLQASRNITDALQRELDER